MIALFAWLAWPGAWGGSADGAPLFDEAAARGGSLALALEPLLRSLVAGFFLLFLATGIAYGRAAGVNRTHRDEIRMISNGMASMAYYIILAFVAAHFVALFNWSNLGAIVLVPMLMLLGMSPEMTTAAYRMGDSVTNPITPLMVCFPLVLTFCQLWDRQFGMGSLIAAMLPYSLAFLAAGVLLTIGWVAVDLPLGPGARIHYLLPTGALPAH